MTSKRLTIAALVAVLVVLWLVAFIEGTGPFDREILAALYGGDHSLLAGGAKVLSFVGGGFVVTPVVVLVAGFLAWRGRARLGLVLLVGNSLGRLLVEFQKHELGRARPDLNPHLVKVFTLSFPSAHSSNAVLTYVAMALLLPSAAERFRWTVAAVILAILIGFSRVILGVHYPSDVIAGWSFGALWVLVMLWFAQRAGPPARVEGGVQ